MLNITATDGWRQAYPGAIIGLLEISGLGNVQPSQSMTRHKRKTESLLRNKYGEFSRRDFLSLPIMAAYSAYYKHFSKTYHVLLQVESIAVKGKCLPNVSPLVDANFTAEVETFILTAGHDADKLEEPLLMDISGLDERMILMNSETKSLPGSDMIMRDQHGICCSILYGQDNQSLISTTTQHVLYVSYAPPGITNQAVMDQLQKIEDNITLFTRNFKVEQKRLLTA
jgi:DNA/RNA-binding domain of Phe-tRNA-synthetase-like protein